MTIESVRGEMVDFGVDAEADSHKRQTRIVTQKNKIFRWVMAAIMKALIRVKRKKLTIGYQQLAKIIWQVPVSDFWVNHMGTDESFHNESWLKIWLNYSDFLPEWGMVPLRWLAAPLSIAPDASEKDILVVYSDHVHEVTATQKGFNNLVYYLAKELDGVIKERNADMWVVPETFKREHEAIMQMPLRAAFKTSITETQTLQPVTEDDDLFSL